MPKLPSTGRRPALNLDGVERLLTRYFEEDHPSIATLASEFEVTQATVRKYLKLALGSLPRGRAATLPREPRNVQHLLNGISTEALLGKGRCELLSRRRDAGESLTALAEEFGISRRRVSALVRSDDPASEAPSADEVPEAEVAMAAGDDA